ncbi:LacI family DNA-binding transcriptional regulator [Deinococcus aestuarii]|uniref:LacI family DNA-binding transcriptional regulator n=1 Tax=Deinococcus aestuarii TaxID=2774531 RepID=UPI001C0C0D47|nr:LacI family DNA-binding transcriptional regulator [Deinococcus aestuarii]
MTKRKKPTISDVALEAGVARSTVSKVVNGTQKLQPETEQRVWEAVSKLGYQASLHAQILSTGRTRALGIVLLDLLNPHFTALVKGASLVAAERGYAVLLVDAQESAQREGQLIETLRARTDGLILAGSRLGDEELATLHDPERPIVTVGRPAAGLPAVTVAEETAAFQLTSHLIAQGRRRICYLAGPPFWVDAGRERGYRAALTRAGLEAQVVRVTSPDVPGGEQASAQLHQGREMPDAAVCYNDLIAIGLMTALGAQGLRIPEDIGVAAFGNHPLAPHLSPPLTLMEIPSQGLGEDAARLLLSLIDCPQAGPPPQRFGVLRVRRSTRPGP